MINNSLPQSNSLYRPIYAYTPLCELNNDEDTDDQPTVKRPTSVNHTNEQAQPSVDNSRKRIKQSPSNQLTLINNHIPEMNATVETPEQSKSQSASPPTANHEPHALNNIPVPLDKNWHQDQWACFKKIECLEPDQYKKWEEYDRCWESIELYQYEHYEKIYLAQRLKLQKQIRSVLEGNHPDLIQMEQQHTQRLVDISIRMISENTCADEMLELERKAIDEETKSRINNMDNELLDYLEEKKRLLLIEDEYEDTVPKDLSSLYKECTESLTGIKQQRARISLLRHVKHMNSLPKTVGISMNRSTKEDLNSILKSIAEP